MTIHTKKEIVNILVERGDMTEREANNLVNEVQKEFNHMIVTEGIDVIFREFCNEWLGLKPDYLTAFM